MEKNVKWKDAILCSGKVNRYGYTLLVSGLRLASFLANPIMLYVHRRSLPNEETDEISLPIGKWDNIRIENGKLLATPDFDMDDEFAVKIARKWEKGYLNATSVCHTFEEVSDEPNVMQEGQIRCTVTKWEILEASIVDIPGDPEAVKLNFPKDGADPLSKIPLLSVKQLKLDTEMDLKNIALSLGLSATATEAEVSAKIASLQTANVEGVLALGRQKGVVNDTNIGELRVLVTANPDFARLSWTALSGMTPSVTSPAIPTQEAATLVAALKAQGNRVTTGTLAVDRKDWTLKDWRTKDPTGFLALELSDPAAFEKIAYSGVGTGMAIMK